MIQINQMKLAINHTKEHILHQIQKTLKISGNDILSYEILKRSIDARKRQEPQYVYQVLVNVRDEKKVLSKVRNTNVSIGEKKEYSYIPTGKETLKHSPVIVGSGPAGLFCGYMLAKSGYMPIIIERGEEVRTRQKTVNHFWETNELNVNSNVQFGEGGAGTFSDGKLNTLNKDEAGRNRKVLQLLCEYGAPNDILYNNKPHIGTDQLISVVEAMRNAIISYGGQVRFSTRLTDLRIEHSRITGIEINENEVLDCDVLVLGIGHSARDTFDMIYKKGIQMSAKSFAVGVRIQHLQSLINKNQYGTYCEELPAAEYKLTHQCETGRGVYSFCMCPGGFVVNSSSENGGLVVNGMSNQERDEDNANSALIVTVTPEDFVKYKEIPEALQGVAFQRELEKAAFKQGKGLIPIQLYGDFVKNRESQQFGKIKPVIKGGYRFANLRSCLPDYIVDPLIEGIIAFDRKIPGFSDPEAIITGIETRTSSPIRIHRNEGFESNFEGIYPCGEGAGYAGGITSAAMDGIKVYEAITSKFHSF